MEEKTSAVLERLAVSGLEKCLARLAKVSAGAWRIAGVRVFRGTIEEAVLQHDFSRRAAAICFNAGGGFPFISLMLFSLEDMEMISKCFLGYSFPKAPAFTRNEQVLLTELGNIIVNSFINSVMNALKRSGMPPVPQCVDGDARRVAAAAGSGADPERSYRVVAASLVMRSGKLSSTAEVIGLMPAELENELERLGDML